MYLRSHPPQDPSKPGPGTYQLPPRVGEELPKYTMRPKAISARGMNVPGPGQYEIPTTIVES